MLQCLSLKSSSSSTSSPAGAAALAPTMHSHPPPPSPTPPPSQGGTSSEASPSATLTHEYTLAVQSKSYSEIWSKIHEVDHSRRRDDDDDEVDEVDEEESHHRRQRLLMEQVLQPNRECVKEALRHAKPNSLTGLVSDYFEQSENTTHVCLLLLHRSVHRAGELYAPLHQLLDVVVVADPPIQQSVESLSLTQSQCIRALQVFLQFDCQDNPFPSPDGSDSQNLDEMRRSFSELKDQLDHRLRSSRSRIRLIRRATLTSSLCLIGTAVGVVVSAVAVTVHALTAAVVLVASPPLCCSESGDGNGRGSCCMMTATEKRQVANMKQLDAASMGTCVLKNDLATLDRLVRRLHAAVEGDKLLIRLGLERGCGPSGIGSGSCDKHPIQEVVKQLNKSRPNFIQLLAELEEHICLCFNTVNRARSLLLQHISNSSRS